MNAATASDPTTAATGNVCLSTRDGFATCAGGSCGVAAPAFTPPVAFAGDGPATNCEK